MDRQVENNVSSRFPGVSSFRELSVLAKNSASGADDAYNSCNELSKEVDDLVSQIAKLRTPADADEATAARLSDERAKLRELRDEKTRKLAIERDRGKSLEVASDEYAYLLKNLTGEDVSFRRGERFSQEVNVNISREEMIKLAEMLPEQEKEIALKNLNVNTVASEVGKTIKATACSLVNKIKAAALAVAKFCKDNWKNWWFIAAAAAVLVGIILLIAIPGKKEPERIIVPTPVEQSVKAEESQSALKQAEEEAKKAAEEAARAQAEAEKKAAEEAAAKKAAEEAEAKAKAEADEAARKAAEEEAAKAKAEAEAAAKAKAEAEAAAKKAAEEAEAKAKAEAEAKAKAEAEAKAKAEAEAAEAAKKAAEEAEAKAKAEAEAKVKAEAEAKARAEAEAKAAEQAAIRAEENRAVLLDSLILGRKANPVEKAVVKKVPVAKKAKVEKVKVEKVKVEKTPIVFAKAKKSNTVEFTFSNLGWYFDGNLGVIRGLDAGVGYEYRFNDVFGAEVKADIRYSSVSVFSDAGIVLSLGPKAHVRFAKDFTADFGIDLGVYCPFKSENAASETAFAAGADIGVTYNITDNWAVGAGMGIDFISKASKLPGDLEFKPLSLVFKYSF